MCTGSRSVPRQGLPGVRQGPSLFKLLPFKNKVLTEKTRPRQEKLAGKDKTPARGACREGHPRHLKELAAARLAPRQGPVSDKLPDATRQRSRQGACRDKLPPYTRAPAHPPTCRPGALPGARGKRLCSQRCTVASGADKITVVANGGVPDGPFLHCLSDTDGHLMPLSPAVRVR